MGTSTRTTTLKHSFNAALLYAAAAQTANRGPSFQLGIAQSISDEMSRLTVPDEIKGQPPFLLEKWRNHVQSSNCRPNSHRWQDLRRYHSRSLAVAKQRTS